MLEELDERTTFVTWVAIVGTVFAIMGGGAYAQRAGWAPDAPFDDPLPIVIAFAITSLAILAAIATAHRWLGPRAPSYFTYAVLRWSLGESIAIYGLVAFLLGAPMWVFGAFCAAAISGLMLTMPGDQDRARWAAARTDAAD